MDSTAHSELIRILLTIMQRDFSIVLCPEVTLPRAPDAVLGPKDNNTVVCIGSSIMQQTIPFLKALGYNVIDLSRPGWLATEDNIANLISSMSKFELVPGFAVVLDLVSNCSIRYMQFDGTLSLAQKEGGRYHLKGPVVTCGEEVFVRILRALSPVLISAQDAEKISIPPLPRYLCTPCCSNPTHCTNLLNEKYAESILNGVTNHRSVYKRECNKLGVKKH
jgi:hypothetical protein